MTGWKYLIGGTLYVISCLSLYAGIKFSGGKLKSIYDVVVLFLLFLMLLSYVLLLLFKITWYIIACIVMGVATTFVVRTGTGKEQRKENKWYNLPLVFIIFSLFSLPLIPAMITIIYFNLDMEPDNK